MTLLTRENEPNVLRVRNIDHPEWGTFRFNYNARRLADGYCSTIGTGSNSRILPWQEYHHWEVVSFRVSPLNPMDAFAQAGWDFARGNK